MSISTISFQLVQIHVILIAFTLPKWMQATASEWASLLQIEFSNLLYLHKSYQLTQNQHYPICFQHLFLLISTPFPVKPPMHFTIWVHSCMYMSEQSLSFLMKTLPNHCKALPTHSYCLEITPSLAISLSPFLRPHTPSTTGDHLCR